MKDTGSNQAKRLFKPAMISGPDRKSAKLFQTEVAALLSIDHLRKLEATTGIEAQFIYARAVIPRAGHLKSFNKKE
jgi:hypothetical protein